MLTADEPGVLDGGILITGGSRERELYEVRQVLTRQPVGRHELHQISRSLLYGSGDSESYIKVNYARTRQLVETWRSTPQLARSLLLWCYRTIMLLELCIWSLESLRWFD